MVINKKFYLLDLKRFLISVSFIKSFFSFRVLISSFIIFFLSTLSFFNLFLIFKLFSKFLIFSLSLLSSKPLFFVNNNSLYLYNLISATFVFKFSIPYLFFTILTIIYNSSEKFAFSLSKILLFFIFLTTSPILYFGMFLFSLNKFSLNLSNNNFEFSKTSLGQYL